MSDTPTPTTPPTTPTTPTTPTEPSNTVVVDTPSTTVDPNKMSITGPLGYQNIKP